MKLNRSLKDLVGQSIVVVVPCGTGICRDSVHGWNNQQGRKLPYYGIAWHPILYLYLATSRLDHMNVSTYCGRHVESQVSSHNAMVPRAQMSQTLPIPKVLATPIGLRIYQDSRGFDLVQKRIIGLSELRNNCSFVVEANSSVESE